MSPQLLIPSPLPFSLVPCTTCLSLRKITSSPIWLLGRISLPIQSMQSSPHIVIQDLQSHLKTIPCYIFDVINWAMHVATPVWVLTLFWFTYSNIHLLCISLMRPKFQFPTRVKLENIQSSDAQFLAGLKRCFRVQPSWMLWNSIQNTHLLSILMVHWLDPIM